LLFAVALAVGAAPLAACSKPEPKSALSYTADAKRAYDRAMEEFKSHNWIESQNLFREVKRKYSYSKYARLAELRIADADFEQDKFSDAIRGYRQFVHDHRSDEEEVQYARSRIAEAQYKQIGDSFLLPSADERDQAAIVDAYKELKGFVHDYPDAKQSAKVRELLEEVTARLVRHELYVARFYLHRDNYDAAVGRILYALKNYSTASGAVLGPPPEAAAPTNDGAAPPAPTGRRKRSAAPPPGGPGVDSGLEPEALLLLGETYLKMHKWKDARDAFEAILTQYSRSPFTIPAQNYLQFMKERGV
jgi:outer membrane protein assembly factor BamD